MTGGAAQGAWLVRARYRSGSLESIVARSRRRNLAISLGVLGLLGGRVRCWSSPRRSGSGGWRGSRWSSSPPCRTSCERRWR